MHAGTSKGTLVVSYQTGPQGERLDRIRFKLINQAEQYQLFPQNSNYASDPESPSRVVVVDNLSPGQYFIEFLLPNSDGLFEEVTKKSVTIVAGERLKINHYFHPRYSTLIASATTRLGIQPFISPPVITLKDKKDRIVGKSETGELKVKTLLPGKYTLVFEELTGYITPDPITLDIKTGSENGPFVGLYECGLKQPHIETKESASFLDKCVTWGISTLKAFLFPPLFANNAALEEYGQISIFSNLPEGRWMIYHDDLLFYRGTGSENDIPVPPDNDYRLRVEEVDGYSARLTPDQRFTVKRGQTTSVSINFEKTFGYINIHASMPKAGSLKISIQSKTPGLYTSDVTLKPNEGKINWTSAALPTGAYIVSFESSNAYIPPPPHSVQITANQHTMLIPELHLPRSVKVITQFPQASFTLKQKKGSKSWSGNGETFTFHDIPPGTYILSFTAPKEDHWQAPKEKKIIVSPYNDSLVKVSYTKVSKPTNDTKTSKKPVVVTPSKNVQQLTPQPIEFAFSAVEGGESITGNAEREEKSNELPARTVDINAFEIGTYEVTNAQYADWLNQAVIKGEITYRQDGALKGLVKDADGHILCKTTQIEPQSQLSANLDTTGKIVFSSVATKNNYPMVEVSWYGAQAFCKDQGLRLPTEAEWEKAAAIRKGPPLKKYKYGFSRDQIDRTWANFRYDENDPAANPTQTTEVGFYNGKHMLPEAPEATHKAVSPVGAYDMTGNVWEWTSDWYAKDYPPNESIVDPQGPESGKQKVVKGGSYATTSRRAQVTERLGLLPDHMDAITGFRVAKPSKR